MSEEQDLSGDSTHIRITVYSEPCADDEWPSIDNFSLFNYNFRNNKPSILREYLDDVRKEPEQMVYLSSAAAIGRSALIFPINGTLAATVASWVQSFDFGVLLAGLRETLPLAGRISGLAALLWPTKMGNAELYQGAGPLINLNRAKLIDMKQADMVVTLPSELVTTIKPEDIRGKKNVPVVVVAQGVVDAVKQEHTVALTLAEIQTIPVIPAKKTKNPNVYTAEVVPGMKPMRIRMVSPSDKIISPAKSVDIPATEHYLPQPDNGKTHHAFIDFGDNHLPVYISVTRKEWQIKPYVEAKKAEEEKKRQGVKDKGHSYHPSPKAEEITGLGELKKGQKKTPKQGGGGKRDRWFGEKGRKVYEWDSQHGELEGYRASDGQHLGAFDPKTGNQLKPADPKRNIKKYL